MLIATRNKVDAFCIYCHDSGLDSCNVVWGEFADGLLAYAVICLCRQFSGNFYTEK